MKHEAKANLATVKAYLAAHGIPRTMVDNIRTVLINDAIQESNAMKYDRIYTAVALAIRHEYGFGPERILRGLREFDRICGSVLGNEERDERPWTEIMEELKEETGIVIHTGDENRLICEVSRE